MDSVIIPNKQYFKIGEVSSLTQLETYVLRYWETEFKSIRPVRMGSNQRLYRRKDVETILEIKKLLYDEGFTIAGAKKKIVQGHKADFGNGTNRRVTHQGSTLSLGDHFDQLAEPFGIVDGHLGKDLAV